MASNLYSQSLTELGSEGDLTVLGTGGTAPDPNVKIKGFTVFGSTQASYAGAVVGPGNVTVNGVLSVSSGAYFVGNSTFTGTLNMAGFDIINASSITVAATKPGLTISTNLFVMNGNVGIGTAGPGAKLDVAGMVRSTWAFSPGDGGGFQSSRYMYDDGANYRTAFSSNVYIVGYASVTVLRGLSAPLTGDSAATKAYVDASLLDQCALGSATPADILAGKSADINCDNFAEVGTLATQTLSVSTDEVKTGVYAATWLSVVDTDLAAANIRAGYNIFGHAGAFTSGATATAGDILNGLTAGVNGAMITGTLTTQTLNPANDTVLAGYYAATTLSAVDADLAAANIKSGVTIFGKAGTLTSGAVPDTGQTTSYTATFGEDHDYQPAGTQLSYTVNGDNTVTDNRTGLMWRRCSQGQNDDATCSGTAGTYTWENALISCEGEATDYTDWRLPNAKELFSIVKFEGAAPFIDQTTFPATVSNYYWTGTTYVPSTTYALYVDFSYGGVTTNGKTNVYYVRCVRAGP